MWPRVVDRRHHVSSLLLSVGRELDLVVATTGGDSCIEGKKGRRSLLMGSYSLLRYNGGGYGGVAEIVRCLGVILGTSSPLLEHSRYPRSTNYRYSALQ